MNNIIIINALNLSDYVYKELSNGLNSIQIVSEYTKSLPDIKKTVWFSDTKLNIEDNSEIINRDNWDIGVLFTTIKEISKDFDNIFYIFADCPCLDKELSIKMYENHIKYFADYTFADGYPYGLTPEIINKEILKNLVHLSDNNKDIIKRDSVFEIIKKDINSFDIETEISPEDMRLLRLKLCADRKINFSIVKKIFENNCINSTSILEFLEKEPKVLRTVPAFYNIQIAEGCPQNCSYCPYPQARDNKTGNIAEMTYDNFMKIVDQIIEYSEKAVISISLWGEPSYHSDIIKIVEYVLSNDNLDLIIETSGLGWQENILIQLKNNINKRPTWIVSLDAWTKSQYGFLRGEGFEEAYSFVKKLSNYFPGSVYVQAVRMKGNENDLEAFYRSWKAQMDNIIIQKYDHFCGFLPDERVTDLSPLKRFPCWHIKRDVNIHINGEVRLCREDIKGEYVLGNIFTDGLEKIWKKGNSFYIDHINNNLPEICKNCDEYYTFNF